MTTFLKYVKEKEKEIEKKKNRNIVDKNQGDEIDNDT